MKKISGLEGEILHKYIKEKELDEKDKVYVNRMINTGLMSFKHLISGKMLVKTTELGYDAS